MIVYLCSNDVCGKKIRSELDSSELCIEGLCNAGVICGSEVSVVLQMMGVQGL